MNLSFVFVSVDWLTLASGNCIRGAVSKLNEGLGEATGVGEAKAEGTGEATADTDTGADEVTGVTEGAAVGEATAKV